MASYRYLVVDQETGDYKRGGPATGVGALFYDQDYDTGPGGQTEFTVTATIKTGSLIDVFCNGIKQREGAGNDFQRNVLLNKIEFNSNIPQNAWVQIRVYS